MFVHFCPIISFIHNCRIYDVHYFYLCSLFVEPLIFAYLPAYIYFQCFCLMFYILYHLLILIIVYCIISIIYSVIHLFFFLSLFPWWYCSSMSLKFLLKLSALNFQFRSSYCQHPSVCNLSHSGICHFVVKPLHYFSLMSVILFWVYIWLSMVAPTVGTWIGFRV